MTIFNRLALGTAQFGMDYGIVPVSLPLKLDEVKQILIESINSGIGILDTASTYGVSEDIIGSTLIAHHFQIITKTLPIRKSKIDSNDLNNVINAFDESLIKMGQKQLSALLVHDANDLLVPGGDAIWRWMEEIKLAGTVNRIGVSLYDCDIAYQLINRYNIDIIQMPCNVLDQRIIDNNFYDFCRINNIAIHVRSIFLQGAILMEPSRLPVFLSGLRPYLEQLRKNAFALNLSIYDLALAFVLQQSAIENIIVGVQNKKQIKMLISSLSEIQNLEKLAINWNSLRCSDKKLIDPRFWNT
jgi:aryl-alcohol dehydrogenase-like predicted oxidoreductase